MFKMLKVNGTAAARVDPEQSLNWPRYIKAAGHPDYKDDNLPSFEDITKEFGTLSARANDAIIHRQNAVTHVAGMRL